MNVPFKLPTPKPVDDARCQLERLYREIGISAVASALHAVAMPSIEDRANAALSSHDLPAILRQDDLAA
jgi:hypothetical protein